MYSVQLSDQERNQLLSFMSRVDLKGSEAQIFVNLLAKIGKAAIITIKDKEGEKAD